MNYDEEENRNIPRYNPDFNFGLTNEQVKERINDHLTNQEDEHEEKTNIEIIKDNVFTYFNLIFFILAFLVILSGSFINLTFLPVVIINTLIGIVQEIRSRNVLNKMQMMNQQTATAIREGKESIIASSNLVLDDIVEFKSGNEIIADAIILDGEVKVNESLLTGESDEITKQKGDSLLSGSYVISGKCYARLDKIGQNSYIAKLSAEAKKYNNQEQSEMIKSLNRLLKVIGIIIIPIGIILFTQGYIINKNSFQQSIITMVAAIIGMIPEGLYLLTTMTLALSAVKLAKQEVLLHDMKSIETLARVDVLCVDKTGTITDNKMEVKELIPIVKNSADINLNELIGDYVSNCENINTTMDALKSYFTLNTGKEAISRIDFSSKYKYSSVTLDSGTYLLGAPEVILKDHYDLYKDKIESYANKGYRILVFGKYNGVLTNQEELLNTTDLLAFIILSNSIRKNARNTFEYFKNQNVQIKVISGDNPITVSQVAYEAGILGYQKYIDASTLRSEEEIEEAVKEYSIFGRVTPKQKQDIVDALKSQGHTVAMTGDGVNDILALKKADCSIAMASGSEATCHAAQLVLLDSDFGHMPSVVLEGRRVVNNIQRSASLFLVKNIFSIIMSVLTIVFMVDYPLEPSHISLISMFTIGIPGYFLALESNNLRIEGNFIKNVLIKSLPAALTNAFVVSILIIFREVFNLSSNDIATSATLLLSLVGFIILIDISKPLSKYRKVIIIGNMLALIICSIFFGNLFAINQMSKICIVISITLSFTADSFYRLISKLINLLSKIEIKIKK